MRMPLLLVAAALAVACLPAGAQQLKPGLWEISNKMKGSGEMDKAMADMQQQLASMPPDQRKQMEAMMAQRGMRMAGPAAGGGMTMQMCMTKEMVERNDVPMQEGCTMTKQQRSGNTMKMAFTCTKPPSSGEGEFTFMGSEAYKSHMVINTSAKGKPETMEMDAAGKWLSADCGSIKPVAPPKK
ncbi:DUF3617 domain-containing protein [Ramlibacter sp. XY19]|uniref:DUF3617 domain-containing protein n=1 Tax=Ramlibacter paludis TaxID=2908000 RepID=UPI0023D9B56F|nr:DUF3617 domain-containing protein [Ramlibacter paludis]MCG2591661.1 DUF3617 domain-containing protein [Ramlibacter paludis]